MHPFTAQRNYRIQRTLLYPHLDTTLKLWRSLFQVEGLTCVPITHHPAQSVAAYSYCITVQATLEPALPASRKSLSISRKEKWACLRLMQEGMVRLTSPCWRCPRQSCVVGKTTATGSDENLSMDILVEDLCALIQKVFPEPATAPVLMV